MNEGKAKKKTANTAKSRLLAEFSQSATDASLAQRMAQLGIPPREMTDSVSLAVSVLLERIDDISRELVDSREEFAELERLVDVDCLAPVPNRRAFMRRMEWAISMFKRYGHPCSIIYFDLNGFKRVNDEYSHAAGDEVIRAVAGVLLNSLRTSDFMARLGGDEFVVLLYHAKYEAARKRAAIIAKRIAEHTFVWKEEKLEISASFGTYEVKEGDTAETTLARADEAMYQQKKSTVNT